jgi:hypothetical protein
MMFKYVGKSATQLVISALVALVIINLFLPFAAGGLGNVLLGLVFQFFLILLGVVTTVMMGDVFPAPLVQEVVIGIGLLSISLFIYSLRSSSAKARICSILVWVSVGAWSTFWGLASSI